LTVIAIPRDDVRGLVITVHVAKSMTIIILVRQAPDGLVLLTEGQERHREEPAQQTLEAICQEGGGIGAA
jgi:hypothetical protein